jgi:hypothetical protein
MLAYEREPAYHVARYDGVRSSALGKGLGAVVFSLGTHDDGSGPALYVGGAFRTVDGVTLNHIGRWDGTSWSSLGSGVDGRDHAFPAQVSALATFDDGSGPMLHAAGYFDTAGGVAANSIAKWDGAAWSPLGGGLDGNVEDLEVFDDGSGPALYAGGSFTHAGGVPANSVAKWSGSTWSALGGGMPSHVQALVAFDDGSGPALYAGNSFVTTGGEWLARWDGTSWSVPGDGVLGPVYAMIVFDDGSGPALYAGGGGVRRWDGSTWSLVGGGPNGIVRALAEFDDGSGPALYACGYFDVAGGMAANRIAKWDGSSWSALGGGISSDIAPGGVAQVYALASFDDGNGADLYVGGYFWRATDSGDSDLARWGCPFPEMREGRVRRK